MRFDRSHLLLGAKVALGATLAIFISDLLCLQYSATAGIITVLSILGTKKETLRVAGGRFLALALALSIAAACFSLLGYTLIGFAAYLFLFTMVCCVFRWPYALSMISVLVTHFLTAKNMTFALVGNEVLLFLIGTGCGILTNLHLRADEGRMQTCMHEVDERMKAALYTLSRRKDAARDLASLQEAIDAAERTALTNADNRITSASVYPLHYVQMRGNQRKILSQISAAIAKLTACPPQYDDVCALLARIADEYHQSNDVSGLLDALDAVLDGMRHQSLPMTRQEFESRAVLYYVLLRVQDFLLLKRQFYAENGPGEVA